MMADENKTEEAVTEAAATAAPAVEAAPPIAGKPRPPSLHADAGQSWFRQSARDFGDHSPGAAITPQQRPIGSSGQSRI